jgi:hypothetical protein
MAVLSFLRWRPVNCNGGGLSRRVAMLPVGNEMRGLATRNR